MICGDIRSAIVLMDMRLEEAQEAARSHIVTRGVVGGPRVKVQQRFCRLLHNLGHGLVAVGKYLERTGYPSGGKRDTAPGTNRLRVL